MTYKIATDLNTGTGERSYQVWRLRYDSDASWEQRLTEDTQYPARVGSVESFDGSTHRRFNALANTTTEDKSTDGTLTAPGEWFVPRTRETLGTKGFAASDALGGAYIKVERIGCPTELEGNLGVVACDADGKVEMDTSVSLDEHGIPLRVVVSVGGTQTSSLEALDLRVR